jgi:hypothetical protein
LRDPITRLLSLYQFLRLVGPRAPSHYLAAAAAAQDGPRALFSSPDPAIINHLDNGYVRRLANTFAGPAGDPLADDPRGTLERAFERLCSFDGAYLLEEVVKRGGRLPHRIVKLLSRALDLDFPEDLPLENVTPETVADREDIDTTLITPRVALDLELYLRLQSKLSDRTESAPLREFTHL